MIGMEFSLRLSNLFECMMVDYIRSYVHNDKVQIESPQESDEGAFQILIDCEFLTDSDYIEEM